MSAGHAVWRDYLALCKPKVVALILFTALVGMVLAGEGGGLVGGWEAWVFGLVGIGLAAGAGAAINHLVDEGIDARMGRTRNRPLPQGRLGRGQALGFALGLAGLGVGVLVVFVNVLTAVLTLASMVGYAVLYSMFLKRMTPQNIVLGGAAGAAPPVLGWCAVTGEVGGEALLLFLIIFVWTPPHFWALAIRRVDEYAEVGVPMLPVAYGVGFTKLQILLYAILLLGVTMMPFGVGMSGVVYLVGAVGLGLGFVYQAVRLLWAGEGEGERAMRTFGYSIFYLSALFGLLVVDWWVGVGVVWV